MKLRVSSDLSLPTDAVTSTIVVYGGKGTGKTNCATVLVEEFDAAGLRFAVIDPMGVWWGLRHDESGKGVGIKVLILGGLHGDLPIMPESGAIVADLVVDEDANVIVDISRRADGSMWSIGERVRFVTDYAKRLYQRQGEKRRPIMQVIDEAARFAPQVVRAGDMDVAKCMGAIAVVVEEGRNVGVGVTLVTQRSARLNKDVAELADCMIAFRTLGPNSVRAVLDWLGEHVEKVRLKDIAATLRELPRGSALVVSPGWLDFEGIVAMRKRRTFDSSKTPEAGKQVRVSGAGAKPDLEKYRERMAAVVERAKENDPTELKKQVASLRKELARVGRGQDRSEGNEKALHAENLELRTRLVALTEDPPSSLKKADLDRLEKIVARAEAALDKHDDVVERHQEACAAALEGFARTSKAVTSAAIVAIDELRVKVRSSSPPVAKSKPSRESVDAIADRARKLAGMRVVTAPPNTSAPRVNDPSLKPAHLRILSAIAWWESVGVSAPDLGGVAFVARTSTKSSAFDNNRSRLRTAGYIDYPSSGRVQLTDLGRKTAPPPTLPPTNEALHEAILGKVTPAHGRMLRVLIAAYPGELSLADFAEQAGTSTSSSAFDNNRSWLRARGLAEYPRTGFVRATELLFPEGAS